MINQILLLGFLVSLLLITIISQALSRRFQIPSIIFLLLLGILAGPEVLNLIDASDYSEAISAVVSILVSIIVFEGGLNVDLKQMRSFYESVVSLTTIGVGVTFVGITILTKILIANITWEMAALFGALVTATGPTVIGPIVRNIRVSRKVANVLELEGILNDAASVILAAVIFEWISVELTGAGILFFILYRIGLGILTGVVSGLILKWIFTRGKIISERTARLLTLCAVFACFALSEYLGNESGILAVAVFGVILGTSDSPYKETVKEFGGDIVIVVLSLIFVILASMLKFEYIMKIGVSGIILVLLMCFLVRPLSVFISMWRSKLRNNEKAFVSFIGPKGVVPASVATYFAFKLDVMGIQGGQTLMGLVFMTVIITVLMSGIFAKRVAKFLKVIPMEILIIGGGKVGQILAQRFDQRGENVMVVDLFEENCKICADIGVQTMQGNGQDINVLKKAGIENAKYFIAATNKDNTNLLLCQIAKTSFGLTGEQIVAKVNDMENLQAFWDLGIRAMSSEMTTAMVIDNMIGTPHLFSMCEVGGEGNILEVKVTNPSVVGRAIKDIKFPEKSLLVMVQRGNESIIAHGNLVLQFDDMITIIGEGEAGKKAADILYR